MKLSPKALRFVIEAVEFHRAHLTSQMESGELDEDDYADAGNDASYLAAIKADLQAHHDELIGA